MRRHTVGTSSISMQREKQKKTKEHKATLDFFYSEFQFGQILISHKKILHSHRWLVFFVIPTDVFKFESK